MEILTQFQKLEQSIISLEIADLVDSRHDDVKRSIDRLVASGAIVQPPMAYEQTLDSIGRPRSIQVYVFSGEQGKMDSITVVAQLSPRFTAALVKRWYELENYTKSVVSQIPQTFAEALQLAADQARQLELAAPKIAFVDNYVAGKGNKTFRQVAKLLQIKEYKFREFLESNRIMYKLNGEWTAYQNHVDAKRFHVKTGVSDFGHTFNHSLFTPKGIEWVAGELAKAKVREVAA